jgi:glutathione S-transferase
METQRPLELFAAPRVCSFAPHVLLREAGIPFELTLVDLRKNNKTTAKGDDFEAIVPKSYVPALRLADGYVLTETAVILRWIADSHPEARLAPPHGTFERLRFDEMLHFIGTELHKGFTPFTLMVGASAESKEWAKERLRVRVRLLDEALGDAPFFFGDKFTAVDAYALWALRTYVALLRTDLPERLARYVARIGERPSVLAALEAEGLRS